MVELLTTLTAVLGTAKKLSEISKKIKDAEVRELIADLRSQLADLKTEIADLKTENQQLKESKDRKTQVESLRPKLEDKWGMYSLTVDAEGRKAGTLFCPRCFDVDGILVSPNRVNDRTYRCPQCKAELS